MHSLCQVLNQATSYVYKWLLNQPSVKEESLTDWMLFEISEKSPIVHYKLYSRHDEGKITGADWEWWFISNTANLRLRVQAKKAQGFKDLYPSLAHTNINGLQIDKLIEDAKKQNAIPLYAFFSSKKLPTLCQKNKLMQGVYLASAAKVYSEFIAGGKSKVFAKDVLAISTPLPCIACCPLNDGNKLPLNYLTRYFAEEFQQDEYLNNDVGIHKELPGYVSRLLTNNRTDTEEKMESFDIPTEFQALLVVDLRN